jgi:hypothetical protein
MERAQHHGAIVQAESVVQPYSVANDFFWKAESMIERFSGFHPANFSDQRLV